jgi:hypothetical protein
MNDDIFRELTQEEAEEAYKNAPDAGPISEQQFAQILRLIGITEGRIPLSEASQEEVDSVFHAM